MTVSTQMLEDLLTTAVEGGSNYWADITVLEQAPDRSYLRVQVSDANGDDFEPCTVTPVDLKRGIALLESATFGAAPRYLSDLRNEDVDAARADVILQLSIFGDVIYG